MKNYIDANAPCKSKDGAPSPIQAATNPDTVAPKTAAELKNDGDPRNKIKNKINNSTEPKKRGRGRPQTHGLSKDPVYGSFREAKRRCTVPSHVAGGANCRNWSPPRRSYVGSDRC